MPLIVDTYNVLHSGLPEAPDEPGADILHLARRIESSVFVGQPVFLVCDGVPPPNATIPSPSFGCRILFAGPGREADTLIEELIAADTAPAALTVVSSDRRILKAARRRRAAVLTSPAFLIALRQPRPVNPAAHQLPPVSRELNDREVDQWLREFGETPPAPKSTPAMHSHAPRPIQPQPAPTTKAQTAPVQPSSASPKAPPSIDPALQKLLRDTGSAIDPADLDMSRWIDGAPPTPPGPPDPHR